MLVTALALASCSTQKLASNQQADDDVYFSKAKAGDVQPIPVYRQQDVNVYADEQPPYADAADDDYYYYDSYASRINRFAYNSPFNYYDDYYYDYASPTTYGNGGWGVNSYAYGGYGFGLGIGFGFGYGGYYGYNPWGYGYGYPYYGYSPYGIGWGGGYPYWGIYSAYGYGGWGGGGYYARARPYRGSGVAGGSNYVNRSVRGVGYNGAYPNAAGYYPGRTVNGVSQRTTNGAYSGNANYGYGQGRPARPQRSDNPNNYNNPPQRTMNSMPSNNSGGNMGGGSGGGSRGGGRPGRP